MCRSSGSRPPAQITWWKNGSTRLVTSEPHASVRQTQSPDGNVSLSSLSFVASPEDDGSLISCRVHNIHIMNEPMEERIRLSVHCKYGCCCCCAPLVISFFLSSLPGVIHFLACLLCLPDSRPDKQRLRNSQSYFCLSCRLITSQLSGERDLLQSDNEAL